MFFLRQHNLLRILALGTTENNTVTFVTFFAVFINTATEVSLSSKKDDLLKTLFQFNNLAELYSSNINSSRRLEK